MVFEGKMEPLSAVTDLGVLDVWNRECWSIPRRRKNPGLKILFFRGEILILVLRSGENFLVIPELKKTPTKMFGRDFLKFR